MAGKMEIKSRVVEKGDIKFTFTELDLSDMYNFTPSKPACRLLEYLSDTYEKIYLTYFLADIVINFAPEEVSIVKTNDIHITQKEALALTWLIDELKTTKDLGEIVGFVKWFVDFDVDKLLELLKRVMDVFRLFDGHEFCYAIKLRDN